MMYGKVKRGEELPQARLNETLVKRIRKEHAAKEAAKRQLDEQYSIKAFSKRYQVNENTIAKVLTYETWKHVREDV